MSPGRSRSGGGAKISAARPAGSYRKGMKPKGSAPRRGGLPSSAIRDRSVPPWKRPDGPTRDISGPNTTVYGRPPRGAQFGTKTIGTGGRVVSRQAVKPQTRKDRRVYQSQSGTIKDRTVVQRMRDGNYAVTQTSVFRQAGGGYGKSVSTRVRKPGVDVRRAMRAAVQGAAFGGRKRVGTKRIGRRVM